MSQGGLFIATDFGKEKQGTKADRDDFCSSLSYLNLFRDSFCVLPSVNRTLSPLGWSGYIVTLHGMVISPSKVQLSLSVPWSGIVGAEVQLQLLLTSALEGGEWWTKNAGALPLERERKKNRYRLDRRLSGPQSRYWHFGDENNILPLSWFESRTIQSVA